METFETDRLIFTLYYETLHDEFIRLFTDETVMEFVDKGVLSKEATDVLWRRMIDEFYPQGSKTIWAVLAKKDRRFVGYASLRPRPDNNSEIEMAYILPRGEWGNGYATEIARRLIKFGFDELDLDVVYATADTRNAASIRVMEKCGMTVVRTEYDETGKYCLYGIRRHY